MTVVGWLQIALVLAAVLIAARPLGLYMARVFQGQSTWASRLLSPVEARLYAVAGIDASKEQAWLGYGLAMLAFNAAGFLLLYALLRLQACAAPEPTGLPRPWRPISRSTRR